MALTDEDKELADYTINGLAERLTAWRETQSTPQPESGSPGGSESPGDTTNPAENTTSLEVNTIPEMETPASDSTVQTVETVPETQPKKRSGFFLRRTA